MNSLSDLPENLSFFIERFIQSHFKMFKIEIKILACFYKCVFSRLDIKVFNNIYLLLII